MTELDIYENIRKENIELTPAQKPSGKYKLCVQFSDNLLYTSGANCRKEGTPLYSGKVGKDVTLEEGRQCAEQCIINILSNLNEQIGDLNRIRRVIKILGFVASAEDFYEQPKVMDAACDLLNRIFGEDGVGARSAIGAPVLPGNIPVEIEILFELKD